MPVSILISAGQSFTITDSQIAFKASDGTTPTTWTSAQVGYTKQMNNFFNDMI
jgi:hypothetical protein